VLVEDSSAGWSTLVVGGLHGLRLRALDGSGEKTFYIKNICSHEAAYEETGNQAVSYTTGVPAMIGAAMLVRGDWQGNGVFNIEQMDPDPFMDMLNAHGLPWTVEEMAGPVNF
jgi:saccharopine dehydrogenase (NAD+, L-lysine-forming)